MAVEYKIGDFLKRFKRPITLIPDKEYKLVTISSKHRGVKLRGLKKGALIKSKMYEVKKGDFIVSGIDARNGAFGIIPEELDGAIVTNDFWYFEIDESIILKRLFLELTATTWFDEICTRGSDGTTNRVRLQKDRFFNQKVVLPDFAEQEKLLQHLLLFKTAKNDLSREIDVQKNLVKRLKKSILQDAIQGQLTKEWRKQNPNIEPASELLKVIKAEKAQLIKEKKIKKEKPLAKISKQDIPFEIPENWVWCRLNDVSIKIHYGMTASAVKNKKDVRLLRITDIQNNKVNWSTVPGCEYSKSDLTKYLLTENDIIIARTGGTIGKSYIVKNISVSSLFASYLIRVIPSENILADYIKIFLGSSTYWRQLYEVSRGDQPNVSGTKLKNLIFPLPSYKEQKSILKRVEILQEKCNSLEQEIARSEAKAEVFMQALLKEAFETKEIKNTKTVKLPALQSLEEKHFVKRKMLASYIINKSANDEKFGDTKFEKLLHLTDYHILKRNLGQEYKQKAAGPYDNKFTVPFFNQTIKAGWFYKQRLGKMNRIVSGKNNIKSQSTYDFFANEELQEIDNLINKFKSFDYKIPEIISTLYAVWNNRIIRNQEISDEYLKQDFLNWDKGKAQYVYPKDRVAPAIKWMKENGFVPDGWGKIIEPPKSKKK